MTINFEEEGSLELTFDAYELAKQVIETSLDYVECPYECEVNLLLTMNPEIHQMNKEFRDVDRPTDVLSFPMNEFDEAGDFLRLDEMEECFHPESGELPLGDIVISKEKVIEQAKEYGHSLKREYAFLIAHSMLHLSGYDHIEENERIVMEEKQRDIMKLLNILR